MKMIFAGVVSLVPFVALMATSACSSSSSGSTTGGTGGSGGASTSSSSSTTSSTSSGSTGAGGGGGAGGGSAAGPGAALKCESSGKNAFDTYGAAGFVAVNKAIFANVNAEVTANGSANVGDSFTKIGTGNPVSATDDGPTFEGKLAAFLVWVYGGPNSIMYTDGKTYVGDNQDMVAAHTGLGITSAQYTYFVTNIVVPALTSRGVKHGAGGAADPNDVSSCFAPPVLDPAFIATIVGH